MLSEAIRMLAVPSFMAQDSNIDLQDGIPTVMTSTVLSRAGVALNVSAAEGTIDDYKSAAPAL